MKGAIPKLIRWETPFTSKQYPSVVLLTTTEPDRGDVLNAIVAPGGIYNYPKYLIDFGRVVAFTCMEEAHAPERDFADVPFEEEYLCAFEYLDSPWLESYQGWAPIYFGNDSDSFYHYLIFGGDNNIEVITPDRPTIETIPEKRTLRIDYDL